MKNRLEAHRDRWFATRCVATGFAVLALGVVVDGVLAADDPDPEPEPPFPYSMCECCHPEFPTICDSLVCMYSQRCRCQWGGGDGDAWVDASCQDVAGE